MMLPTGGPGDPPLAGVDAAPDGEPDAVADGDVLADVDGAAGLAAAGRAKYSTGNVETACSMTD